MLSFRPPRQLPGIWRLLFYCLLLVNVFALFTPRSSRYSALSLTEARSRHITRLTGSSLTNGATIPEPPPGTYRVLKYPSPAGPLAAYLTSDPGDGKKRPAVIWGHGGFRGIGDDAWELDNDQSPRAFLRQDFVLMCPTWRGEVDNPGRFELYYGEAQDLIAAAEYLKTISYVDPRRIYFVGYSASGTLGLLASEIPNGFRAIFSIGGGADFSHEMADGKGYEQTPFDAGDKREIELRNPRSFVGFMETPVYFFEGGGSWYAPDGCRMEITARAMGKPFQAIIVPGAHHWSVLQPACDYISQQILLDTHVIPAFSFTAREARRFLVRPPSK